MNSKETTYKCTVCCKTLTKKSNLTVHMRMHTKETPYKCTVCDKAFKQSSNLTDHTRIHTGEKPFSCVWCAKSFTQLSNKNSHMRLCKTNIQQGASRASEQKNLTDETSSTVGPNIDNTYEFTLKEELIE